MKKILIGFDGSDCSEQALNKATTLIEEHGELILLSVIPKSSDKFFVDDEIRKKLKQKAARNTGCPVGPGGPSGAHVGPLRPWERGRTSDSASR